MYKVAIVDDLPEAASALARMVEAAACVDRLELLPLPEHVDADVLRGLLDVADILFLDVQLGLDGKTGIDLVGELLAPDSRTQVIYVTGYLENAPAAYHTRHTWLLSKPVDPAELDAALAKAVSELERVAWQPLVVRVKGASVKVDPSSISYVESSRRKAVIHADGRTIEAYAKLDDLERLLPSAFARCHKSFLVNMGRIEKVEASELVLLDGTRIPVSHRLHSALADRFVDYATRSL